MCWEQFRIGAEVKFLQDKSGTLTTEEAALDDSERQIIKNLNLEYSDGLSDYFVSLFDPSFMVPHSGFKIKRLGLEICLF